MIKLIAVDPNEAFKLLLRFSDSTWGVHDFNRYVEAGTPMTAPLRDPDFFARHFIELGSLAWPNGFDLSADALHLRLEKVGELRREAGRR